MYESFYGLREKPFNLTPDPRFLFLSPAHRDAIAYVTYGLREKRGFLALTGQVGVGKTTVVRKVFQEMGPTVDRAFVLNTKLTFKQMLGLVLDEFGMGMKGKSKAELLIEFNNFLVSQLRAGRNTVIVIDEAHNLSPAALEELRMLSNLETDTEKLVQILLVGQNELVDILDRLELRQLRQRIPGVFNIGPLSAGEVKGYVEFRLDVAGRSGGNPSFSEDSFEYIFGETGGIPRLINLLCDCALLVGYVEGSLAVDRRILEEASKELGKFRSPIGIDDRLPRASLSP
ncbi:MAG: AAA family ATPase [Candidatus Eisenbacteria bacterium]|nr:AAA family ATPase [Candidatus Eisenbacteria bacterium]